jgi:hypothetical protein
MAAAPRAGWTSANSLEAVRPPVRELLTAIPAFDALEPEERRALAANMVKVMSYIADPNGVGSEANTAANPFRRRSPAGWRKRTPSRTFRS